MFLIRSGIPSLDGLFRPGNPDSGDLTWEKDQSGIFLRSAKRTTSICIAGPDGTGKSVLAMHFASRYLADCHEYCRGAGVGEPLAFYVSSDLSHSKAEAMWTNFGLGAPNARLIPFKYPQLRDEAVPRWLGGGSYDMEYRLRLEAYAPDRVGTRVEIDRDLKRLDDLADYLHEPRVEPQIAFIDLASHTAGDDWGFTERLLALMPDLTPHTAEAPRHLLLIDAMEGMETFAGDVDAFGQKTTRRGRVAKLMRLASTKCHLILIIEEPQESVRMAEQFVADVVLRLRATESQGYSRRTVEIEKARGQAHVRGRHPYVVRDGGGSTTGEQVNFDDPPVEENGISQSYLDVFSSLHSVSRSIMENRAPGRDHPSHRRAGFGIDELDEMLAKAQPRAEKDADDDQMLAHGQDDHGLPCGAVSALIGDANTQKTFLGHAFLGHVFHNLAWDVLTDDTPLNGTDWRDQKEHARTRYVTHLCDTAGPGSRCDPIKPEELPMGVCRWAQRIEEKGRGLAGAVVLVTTKDENNRTLAEWFCNQLREETQRKAGHEFPAWKDPDFLRAFAAYIESRTICRRLEIHDTPSAVLYHVIRRTIEAAQQIVLHEFADVCVGEALHPDAAVRAKTGWRIRFVLDDFNSVMRTYGRVHDDPLFLPFLLVYLRREGLSSLIIETQSGAHGMPAMAIGDDAQSDLRALSDYRLYTWHITDFFGDHRIAIAAIPPMVQQDRKSPVIVRELEWYEPNSETSMPKVNPRFELYAGLDANKPTLVPLRVHLYAETSVWQSYITNLDELWKRVFEPPTFGRPRKVVVGEKAHNYELMHEVCDLLASTNLDYSLVIQIDEFWRHHDSFRLQSEYMSRAIDEAPNGHTGAERVQAPVPRLEWFDDNVGYGLGSEGLANLDRIPFFWDFGFLACREDLWAEAIDQGAREGKKRDEIRRVWGLLTADEPCSWRDVLRAASYVADWESARQSRPVPAFDLTMAAPQTFACLVLEIWFSEIYDNYPAMAERLAWLMERRRWELPAETFSLSKLLEDYEPELYRAWLLLAQSLNLGAFEPRQEGFGFAFGRKADPSAIVTRHWYKSAALIDSSASNGGPVRFCRLPGHFSTRGDWFLTTVRGSRSDRLADRAVDLLSTREANVERLMHGLGLPTRKLNADRQYLSSRLQGSFGSETGRRTLTYEDVLMLGVTEKRNDFHWLWRGNLQDYDASARIWERWLYRILRRWKRTREHFASDWVNGFELYRMIKENAYQEIQPHVVSYKDFPIQRDRLLGELKQTEGKG